jgi:hypothetical protein
MELVGILIGHMYFFLMFKVRSTIIEEGIGQRIHSSPSLKIYTRICSAAFSALKPASPVNKYLL